METSKPTAGGYAKTEHGKRGEVSPIGGRSNPYRTDMQIYVEKKDRAQTPRSYGEKKGA